MLFIIGCLFFIFAVHEVFSKLEFLTCWPDFVFNNHVMSLRFTAMVDTVYF